MLIFQIISLQLKKYEYHNLAQLVTVVGMSAFYYGPLLNSIFIFKLAQVESDVLIYSGS